MRCAQVHCLKEQLGNLLKRKHSSLPNVYFVFEKCFQLHQP